MHSQAHSSGASVSASSATPPASSSSHARRLHALPSVSPALNHQHSMESTHSQPSPTELAATAAAAAAAATRAANSHLPPPGLDAYMQHQFPAVFQQHLRNVDMYDFKSNKHQLPLARIKKIMKSDEDVRMISAEAPVLFAKACELFILDLTLRAYAYPEHSALGSAAGASATGSVGSGIPRRTLQRNDIALAIHNSELFDFLQDIVPVLPHNPDEEGTPTQTTDPEYGFPLGGAAAAPTPDVLLERPLLDPYGDTLPVQMQMHEAQQRFQMQRTATPPSAHRSHQQLQQQQLQQPQHPGRTLHSSAAAAAAAHESAGYASSSAAQQFAYGGASGYGSMSMAPGMGHGSNSGHGNGHGGGGNANANGGVGGGMGYAMPGTSPLDFGMPAMSRGSSLDMLSGMAVHLGRGVSGSAEVSLSTPHFGAAAGVPSEMMPPVEGMQPDTPGGGGNGGGGGYASLSLPPQHAQIMAQQQQQQQLQQRQLGVSSTSPYAHQLQPPSLHLGMAPLPLALARPPLAPSTSLGASMAMGLGGPSPGPGSDAQMQMLTHTPTVTTPYAHWPPVSPMSPAPHVPSNVRGVSEASSGGGTDNQ